MCPWNFIYVHYTYISVQLEGHELSYLRAIGKAVLACSVVVLF